MGGMTMSTQEEVVKDITSGLKDQVATSDDLREPAGWQIVVQTMNRLEQSMHSDSLSRETKTEIGGMRQEMRDNRIATDNKIEALRQEVKVDLGTMRQEIANGFTNLRKDIKDDISDLRKDIKWVYRWVIGAVLLVAVTLSGYLVKLLVK